MLEDSIRVTLEACLALLMLSLLLILLGLFSIWTGITLFRQGSATEKMENFLYDVILYLFKAIIKLKKLFYLRFKITHSGDSHNLKVYRKKSIKPIKIVYKDSNKAA